MSVDIGDREVQALTCRECRRDYKRVVIFAKRNGDAYSVISIACHGHADREAWLDATFGSWEEPFKDHVSFSCRVAAAGAGVVDALVASKGEADYYGQRLTREQALDHPYLPNLWGLVDLIVAAVPEVREVL